MSKNTNPKKYQTMPALSPEERALLKVSGVLVSVEYDENGNILDGHHRVDICAELGITDFPKVVRKGLMEKEKYAYSRQINMVRRHLNQKQMRDVVKEQLKETTKEFNRSIAKKIGVDHKTVASVRTELESTGEIPQLDKTVGSDGKKRAAKIDPKKDKSSNDADTSKDKQSKASDTSSSSTKDSPKSDVIISPKAAKMKPDDLASEESEVPPEPDAPALSKDQETNVDEPESDADAGAEKFPSSSEYYPFCNEVMKEINIRPHSFAEEGKSDDAANSKKKSIAGNWSGKVWLNLLPLGDDKSEFVNKLISERKNDNCTASMVLCNSDTQSSWFQELLQKSDAVYFQKADAEIGQDLNAGNENSGLVVFYMGKNAIKFLKSFSKFGVVVELK